MTGSLAAVGFHEHVHLVKKRSTTKLLQMGGHSGEMITYYILYICLTMSL